MSLIGTMSIGIKGPIIKKGDDLVDIVATSVIDACNENNIALEEAFAQNSRNKMAHLIISKELIRCNSSIEVGNFRELVKGHLDAF